MKKDRKRNKTYISLLFGAAAILILIFAVYLIPRIIVIKPYEESIRTYAHLGKIKLEQEYIGESAEVKSDWITLRLPLYNKVKGTTESYDVYNESITYKGNGYGVILTKHLPEFYKANLIDTEEQFIYLDSKSMSEYSFRLTQMSDRKPSLFQPKDELEIEYNNYFDLYLYYGLFGNYYASYEKDNYAFCVIVNQKTEDDERSNTVRINIYDKNDNFNEIAFVYVQRDTDEENDKAFSSEEILFILDSIVIDLPEFTQTD